MLALLGDAPAAAAPTPAEPPAPAPDSVAAEQPALTPAPVQDAASEPPSKPRKAKFGKPRGRRAPKPPKTGQL